MFFANPDLFGFRATTPSADIIQDVHFFQQKMWQELGI